MGFFWFLLVIAFAAVVLAILLSTGKEREGGAASSLSPKLRKNLGSPLFAGDDGKKRIVVFLTGGEYVWALTPFGPQFFVVTKVVGREAHMKNGEFEALAFLDADYFSDSLAEKMDNQGSVWRIQTILPIQTPVVPANDPRWESANRHWIEDEFDYGEDFFHPMTFYFFLFGGFDQPWTYYEMYETPIYEDVAFDEPIVEEPELETEPEPDVDETGEFVPVQPEATEETFEKMEPEPEPEPVPEPPVEEKPQPVPEPTPEPPAWEPEPQRDTGGDDYDSGGSDDSGSDDSGSDD